MRQACFLARAALDFELAFSGGAPPVLAGISILTDRQRRVTASADACGMFVEWVTA
jgi:hypothetical protein